MADNNFIVSIDIGSYKIAVLLAEEVNGKLSVFGHAQGNSLGVEKGVVVDTEKCSEAIKKVAEAARLSCNTNFHNVSVNISDENLTAISREGQIFVKADKVTKQDINEAVKTACAVPTPMNKQVISSTPNCYTLDKDPITHQGTVVEQPIGQQATTLGVNMYIVTVSNQYVDAVEQSIRKSGLGLSNIVLSSMASSEAYITQAEKDSGICLIDIGSGVSNISVFTQGSITHSAVFQVAGDQITEAIANAFNTSFAQAEYLKLEYGNAQSGSIHKDRLIKFQQINDAHGQYCYLSHQSLLEVIEQSYLSLFTLIQQDLKFKNLHRSLKSGFVLTGGASKIKGCEALSLSFFKIRSQLGRVNTQKITAEIGILDPIYGCALGLLLFEPATSDFVGLRTDKNDNIFGKIKQKFKF